ncbi:MAG: class I SAM-dependent methyltransferase [Candidatus Dormibacteraeota bacterium]|nr:class I SAM-dependent methyltransferase [Candidatus Dormibacteraeota bacterium]
MPRLNTNEFRHLQETWDTLGAEDPLWAVLSAPGTRGNRWDREEFFATGRAEIESLFDDLATRGVAVQLGRALDFGCGAGRLSQALAARFDRVDGVDIAPSMVAAARRFNRHGERCTYHVNERADLSLFDDGVFDLIYSRITLQHIPTEFTKRYLVEFARVLRAGGVAVIHIPTGMTPLRGVVFRMAMTRRRLARRLGAVRRSASVAPQVSSSRDQPLPQRKHEMYFLPQRTVTQLLEQHGLVIAAVEEGVNDGVHDVLYIVAKPLGRTGT